MSEREGLFDVDTTSEETVAEVAIKKSTEEVKTGDEEGEGVCRAEGESVGGCSFKDEREVGTNAAQEVDDAEEESLRQGIEADEAADRAQSTMSGGAMTEENTDVGCEVKIGDF